MRYRRLLDVKHRRGVSVRKRRKDRMGRGSARNLKGEGPRLRDLPNVQRRTDEVVSVRLGKRSKIGPRLRSGE